MNIEVTKKISGDTSIFGGDQPDVTQEAKSTCADILEYSQSASQSNTGFPYPDCILKENPLPNGRGSAQSMNKRFVIPLR